MAELLVMAVDPGPDAHPMRYRKGDVIEVYPDGHCTEPASRGSGMTIVKLPGVAVAEVRKYLDPVWDDTKDIVRRQPVTRRRYQFAGEPAAWHALESKPLAEVQESVVDRITGRPEMVK